MADSTIEALLVDLLAWLAEGERGYEEVLETWRTSCPKLPVWEEANDRGFVARDQVEGQAIVRITQSGRSYLARQTGS